MSYAIKYQSNFDPVGPVSANPVYTLQILEKDYGGSPIGVICSGVPVVHSWQTDDPKAPIKGSSLSINLINQNGSLPLESFFSTDDDQFQVQFFWNVAGTPQLMFIGFLVQDDCSETLVDFTHEINLSANDNLGLLKDVALNRAPKQTLVFVATYTVTGSSVAPNKIKIPATTGDLILPGDILVIPTPPVSGTFTVVSVNDVGADSFITTTTPLITTGSGTLTINHYRPDLYSLRALSAIINTCLAATGLGLHTFVWGSILEVSQSNSSSFINQTLIDPQTFLKDSSSYNNFNDCYSILEKIMARFHMSLFLAKGVWNIMRWDELRYYSNAMVAYEYDEDFAFVGSALMDNVFTIGIGHDTVAQTGLLRKILRPFEFDKETFNYKQPARLLRNYDLEETGILLNTTTTGSGINLQTINEYEATWWQNAIFPGGATGTSVFFIRVISDYLGNEIERYLVVLGPSAWPAMSYKIEAAAGDGFKFSFSARTNNSIPGGILSTYILLDDGVQPHQLFVGGLALGVTTNVWEAIDSSWALYLDPTDDTNIWHSGVVDTTIYRIPFDGLLYFMLSLSDNAAGTETHFKDLRLEYLYQINESTKIIGQTHKTEQIAVIKQNEDTEIFMDTSPRNSIAGTLFLPTMTGLLQDRAQRWQHSYIVGESETLGELTTFEEMFWRRVPRTILDGTFYGLISSIYHVSVISVFNYPFFTGLNFAPGMMEIDYKNNNFKGTLWEIWKEGTHCSLYTFSVAGAGAWSISGLLCDGTPFSYSSIVAPGTVPATPICAQDTSLSVVNIITTLGANCGTAEKDGDLISTYEFKYLYSTK